MAIPVARMSSSKLYEQTPHSQTPSFDAFGPKPARIAWFPPLRSQFDVTTNTARRFRAPALLHPLPSRSSHRRPDGRDHLDGLGAKMGLKQVCVLKYFSSGARPGCVLARGGMELTARKKKARRLRRALV